MKYVALIVGLIVAAAAWSAPLLQYSDETAEGSVSVPNEHACLIEVKMPVGCSTISKVRFYTTTGGTIKLIIYDQSRVCFWWRMKNYPLGEYWGEYRVAERTLPPRSTFYVGWRGVETGGSGIKLGLDRDETQYQQYMWKRDNIGRWEHPEWHSGPCTFMLGVYVEETPAVEPTSLGKVRAIYR